MLVLAGCGGAPSTDTADVACPRFRAAAADWTAEVLTVPELRAALIEVRDMAEYSEQSGIPEAATDMVAAVTGGFDDAALADAVARFDQLCTARDS